jgi:hypothetical protein
VGHVRLGYRVVLLAVVLAAAAFVAVSQIHAAHSRAQGRAAAADATVRIRGEKALATRAAQLIASVPRPRSLRPQPGQPPCLDGGGPSLCFTAAAPPARALVPAVRALAAVLHVQPTICTMPARERRTYGKHWLPCSAHAQTMSTRDGDIYLTVTAFPLIDKTHSRPGHLKFSGTRLSISADWEPRG